MELYEVTVEYVKYLRKFEPTKIMSNADGKEQRKFLGVIVQKNGYKYVIPLSSPKYKKDYKIRDYQGENLPEDFSFVAYADRIILLKDTNVPVVYMYEKKESGEIDFFGKIQCNNMIPAPESELTKINIEGITDIAYKTLLQKQVQFIRKNQDNILKKHANVVYVNRKKGRMDIGYIKNATPDFELLEAKCDEWIIWHENKE